MTWMVEMKSSAKPPRVSATRGTHDRPASRQYWRLEASLRWTPTCRACPWVCAASDRVRGWRGEMTWTSRAPLDQLGRRTSAGRALDSAIRGAQSGRLSSLEDHVSNGVVTTDTVAIAHLVVTEGVSNTATLGAGKLVVVQWDPKPVAKTWTKLTILEVETERGRGDHIQPVVGVRESRWEGQSSWSRAWWELKITGFQKQSCRWQRRGHPVGGGYRCHPGSASLGERRKRRWRPLFRSRGPRREGGGQADLRSEEQSGAERGVQEDSRGVKWGTAEHLYYKGGMPSAKTSLIEAHPRYFLGPFGWSSRNHEQ